MFSYLKESDRSINGVGIKTPEILAKIDIPRQKLYYLEQKGFIAPQKIIIGEKAFREYSEEDVRKVEHIWKYLKKGFKYKIAYEKAMEELENPQLSLIKTDNPK
jgi:DNA-binding transcriptional MerR regulator